MNVCIHRTRPMQLPMLFANLHRSRISSGVVRTGLNTTFAGIDRSRPQCIGYLSRILGDLCQRHLPIEMLTASNKPDFQRLQISPKTTWNTPYAITSMPHSYLLIESIALVLDCGIRPHQHLVCIRATPYSLELELTRWASSCFCVIFCDPGSIAKSATGPFTSATILVFRLSVGISRSDIPSGSSR